MKTFLVYWEPAYDRHFEIVEAETAEEAEFIVESEVHKAGGEISAMDTVELPPQALRMPYEQASTN